jgi:hypothetical protein
VRRSHIVRGTTSPLLATVLAAVLAVGARAQGRPLGAGRIWWELGIAAAAEARRCTTCVDNATVGGASLSAVGGVTLPHGLGVALLARAFQQFGFESPLNSRYVVGILQFTPSPAPVLTLNAGAGRGRHTAEQAADPNNGIGAVLYGGAALRVPPRGGLALSITADVLETVDGAPRPHPRLFSVGLAIGGATPASSR